MRDVDCMACIANLAAGCPTNGHVQTVLGVTHAMTNARRLAGVFGNLVYPVRLKSSGDQTCPTHVFVWNYDAGFWTSRQGIR